ncbi:MAG: hypothetical protein ACK5KR_00745 [Breznakia sp.]
MANLINLKKELKRVELKINELKEKEKVIKNKVELEELAQIKQAQKMKGMTHDELIKIIENAN